MSLAISDMVEAWTGEPQMKFTVHPHCGCATYVFKNGDELAANHQVDVKLRRPGTIEQETRGKNRYCIPIFNDSNIQS